MKRIITNTHELAIIYIFLHYILSLLIILLCTLCQEMFQFTIFFFKLTEICFLPQKNQKIKKYIVRHDITSFRYELSLVATIIKTSCCQNNHVLLLHTIMSCCCTSTSRTVKSHHLILLHTISPFYFLRFRRWSFLIRFLGVPV